MKEVLKDAIPLELETRIVRNCFCTYKKNRLVSSMGLTDERDFVVYTKFKLILIFGKLLLIWSTTHAQLTQKCVDNSNSTNF